MFAAVSVKPGGAGKKRPNVNVTNPSQRRWERRGRPGRLQDTSLLNFEVLSSPVSLQFQIEARNILNTRKKDECIIQFHFGFL